MPKIDKKELDRLVDIGIRFLDNVIDANIYPLEETGRMVLGNRKIGLGIMGFAGSAREIGGTIWVRGVPEDSRGYGSVHEGQGGGDEPGHRYEPRGLSEHRKERLFRSDEERDSTVDRSDRHHKHNCWMLVRDRTIVSRSLSSRTCLEERG